MPVPKRVAERIAAGIKKYQPVLAEAKTRDITEADTASIVRDMLDDLFGYDKLKEVTSEHAVKATYCDLAIAFDGALQMLIEVKAIGIELKTPHIHQATTYAAHNPSDWVALTNAESWRIYKVVFEKPIDAELVLEFNIGDLNSKDQTCIEMLYTISREGWRKSALAELEERKQALNRYFLGAVLLSDPVLSMVRKELRQLSPSVKIDKEQIGAVLMQEVLKREVLEGDKADFARKRLNRALHKPMKEKQVAEQCSETADASPSSAEAGT